MTTNLEKMGSYLNGGPNRNWELLSSHEVYSHFGREGIDAKIETFCNRYGLRCRIDKTASDIKVVFTSN